MISTSTNVTDLQRVDTLLDQAGVPAAIGVNWPVAERVASVLKELEETQTLWRQSQERANNLAMEVVELQRKLRKRWLQ